jgi:hypothetical protein
VTDINAYELSSETKKLRYENSLEASHFFALNNVSVKAAENKRIFVRVPKGISAISVKLKSIQESATSYKESRVFLTFVHKGQQIKQEVMALDVRNNRVSVGESMVGIPTSQPGHYEIIITGSTAVKESVFNLEVRGSGVVSGVPPTVPSVGGRVELIGLENIKEKSWSLKPVSTPWLMIEDLKFSSTEPKNSIELGIGSTLSFVYNFSSPFRIVPIVGSRPQPDIFSPVLAELNGKPLVEDIDFVLGADGFINVKGPARPLIVHLYADYLPKGVENIGIKMVTKVAPAPVFEVQKVGQNVYRAVGVTLSAKIPEGAFVSTAWSDGFLGFSTPNSTETVFVNGKSTDDGELNSDIQMLKNIFREILDSQLLN